MLKRKHVILDSTVRRASVVLIAYVAYQRINPLPHHRIPNVDLESATKPVVLVKRDTAVLTDFMKLISRVETNARVVYPIVPSVNCTFTASTLKNHTLICNVLLTDINQAWYSPR